MTELDPTELPAKNPADHRDDFGSKVRRAYVWTIAGSGLRYLAGFVISIVLARLLTPADYGLLGMTLVCTDLLSVVYEWGISKAIVHLATENEQEHRVYFTISFALGVLFAGFLYLVAPVVAQFYGEPRLIPVLRIMCFALVPGSIRSVAAGIMAKRLQFKELSFGEIVATLIAGSTAIVLAANGYGVWSLVANMMLFWVLQTFFYAWYVPVRLTLRPDPAVVSRLLKYAAPVIGSSTLNSVYNNADNVVVGRVLGTGALGAYALGFRLASLINDKFSAVFNRVAFPTFANLKDDPQRLVQHLFAVTRRVSILTFPLLALLATCAEDFVLLVVGAQWRDAIVPLQFLCAMTAARIATNILGQVLTAVGHPGLVLRYDIASAILLPISFILACKAGGLVGLGIAWCSVFPLLRLSLIRSTARLIGFRVMDYLGTFGKASALALVSVLSMLPALFWMDHGWPRFATNIGIWMVVVGSVILLDRSLKSLVLQSMTAFLPSSIRGRFSSGKEDKG